MKKYKSILMGLLLMFTSLAFAQNEGLGSSLIPVKIILNGYVFNGDLLDNGQPLDEIYMESSSGEIYQLISIEMDARTSEVTAKVNPLGVDFYITHLHEDWKFSSYDDLAEHVLDGRMKDTVKSKQFGDFELDQFSQESFEDSAMHNRIRDRHEALSNSLPSNQRTLLREFRINSGSGTFTTVALIEEEVVIGRNIYGDIKEWQNVKWTTLAYSHVQALKAVKAMQCIEVL